MEFFNKLLESTEMIDDPRTAPEEIDANLREMAWLNRRLGGWPALRCHARPVLSRCRRPARVLELACGGGDLLRALVDMAHERNIPLTAVGLDRHPRVIANAEVACRGYTEIGVMHADAFAPPFADGSFDLVVLANFLHHLPPERAVEMLHIAVRLSRDTVIITDLRRSPLAYHGFRLLAPLAGFSPMTRYDGCLSIRRAYTPAELHHLARKACLPAWSITRHAFFRLAMVLPGGG